MGFPEECFLPQEYNFAVTDHKLDMVVALLAMGKDDYNGIVSWGSLRSASCPRSTSLPGPIPSWTAMGKDDYNGIVSWGSLSCASCPRSTSSLGSIPS